MPESALEVTLQQQSTVPLDVRFTVMAGRMLALVGPSGAGKTTILRSIAGLYRPGTGRIVCNGEVWLDTAVGVNRAPHQRHTGLVFQSYALFPHLSALANVEIALGQMAPTPRRAAAMALLSRVHLDGLESRRPAALSGGEQQRVALARALAREPHVLLLDEPFSAIDRRTRRGLQADLALLRRQLNIPIVLVTHDLDDVLTLADDVVVIERGQMLQSGPLQVVRDAPASELVRDIFDVPPT